jgi:hypothetical protein
MRKTPLGASGTLLESAARKMRGLDWERLAIFYARIALGAAFLSGIASRFGLCHLLGMGRACRCELQVPKLESEPDFGGSSAGRNSQNLVEVGALALRIRLRETIEVLAQDFARQKDGRNAQVAVLNLGGNEMLLSLVQFGMGDVSDRGLVQATIYP